MQVKLTRRRFLALAGSAVLAYMISGSVKTYNIEVEKVDTGLGKTILFAPDIHTHGADRKELVEIALEAKPDILILGGDVWDRLTPAWSPVEDLLARLKRAAKTVVYVPGNHEHAASRIGRIPLRSAISSLEDLGVYALLDDKMSIRGVMIAGLDWKDNPNHYEDAAKMLGEADVTVAHSPDALPHLHPKQQLLLAGHTHGGQVCLPGKKPLKTNSIYGYAWGTYRHKEATMLLSRGAGEMIPPRLYCSRHLYLLT